MEPFKQSTHCEKCEMKLRCKHHFGDSYCNHMNNKCEKCELGHWTGATKYFMQSEKCYINDEGMLIVDGNLLAKGGFDLIQALNDLGKNSGIEKPKEEFAVSISFNYQQTLKEPLCIAVDVASEPKKPKQTLKRGRHGKSKSKKAK